MQLQKSNYRVSTKRSDAVDPKIICAAALAAVYGMEEAREDDISIVFAFQTYGNHGVR